jgi:hypothetical protein
MLKETTEIPASIICQGVPSDNKIPAFIFSNQATHFDTSRQKQSSG